MTQEEFDKKSWGANMKCTYMGETRDIASVNFTEKLIGLSDGFEEELSWVRCENITLI